MANIDKHSKPAAATVTSIYEAPADNVTISTVCVCNTDTVNDDTYSIRVVPKNDTRGDEHLIVKGNTLTAGNSKFITVGLTPKLGTQIYGESTNGDVSFSLYGKEGV